MSQRVHLIALPGPTLSANLCLYEDYVVVAGQTAAGVLVLPTCSNVDYLCPGGLLGMPYLPELGRDGGRFDFVFPEAVIYILVATTSITRPMPQAVYTPPVQLSPTEVTKLQVEIIKRGEGISFSVFSRNGTFWGYYTVPFPEGDTVANLSAQANARLIGHEVDALPSIGVTLTDLDPFAPNV
jgi:hypothetical protein